jgi:hypothetical protein
LLTYLLQSRELYKRGNREENYKVLQQVKKVSKGVRMAMPFEININKENRF